MLAHSLYLVAAAAHIEYGQHESHFPNVMHLRFLGVLVPMRNF